MIMFFKAMQRAAASLPGRVAEHAFFFMLLLIAAAGILSLLLFYAYGYRQAEQAQRGASPYDFKEELFRDTLQVLQERTLNLEGAKREIFKDIFNPY